MECAIIAVFVDWLGQTKRDARDAQPRKRAARASIDPALKVLLERRDDRLLRDAGLTRERLLGEEAHFWSEWLRRRAAWDL